MSVSVIYLCPSMLGDRYNHLSGVDSVHDHARET